MSKIENQEIPNKLLEIISTKLQVNPELKSEWMLKLAELRKQFLTGQAVVYCEDCGAVFFNGKTEDVVNENDFTEWKMLSSRHVWDRKHKVKVYMPYFLATGQMIANANPFLNMMVKNVLRNLGFDENNQVNYYLQMEGLRERLQLQGSERVNRSFDLNWDNGSKCVCSVCRKTYVYSKDACLCHAELKPWLPMDEVNSICNVRRLK
jgi:hypothetical protein